MQNVSFHAKKQATFQPAALEVTLMATTLWALSVGAGDVLTVNSVDKREDRVSLKECIMPQLSTATFHEIAFSFKSAFLMFSKVPMI